MATDGAETGEGARPTAMQGGGFYNRHSTMQEANLVSALPLLEEAASAAALPDAGALVLVDYGSSEGRNSLAPVRAAIERWRARVGSDRAIEVIHADLPSNDFTTLFTLLDEAPGSYLAGDRAVFPSAVGRSYYAPIRPPQSVDLGWSSNALHWMSRNPIEVRDHGWAILGGSAEARAAVARQQDEDWLRFLQARGSELRAGGRVVCQFMGQGDDHHGFEWMAGAFWDCWEAMARDGLVTDAELRRMTIGSAGRTVEQIERPFAQGRCAGLALTHLSVVRAPDPFWRAYQEKHDAARLGQGWANMMRAANGPSFAAGLDPDRDKGRLLDELTLRLAERIAADPQTSISYNILLTLEKAIS
jgi:cyclopropane-fatty-acyl-phospholipid synthase